MVLFHILNLFNTQRSYENFSGFSCIYEFYYLSLYPDNKTSNNMTDKELEIKWKEFTDVYINDNDEIDEDWWIFEKGTDKYYIWDYFDEKHSKGVAYLLNLE